MYMIMLKDLNNILHYILLIVMNMN